MFLAEWYPGRWRLGLPHARGGVSIRCHHTDTALVSSPRTWGCFLDARVRARSRYVFPTHVGVFLNAPSETPGYLGLPHARGGVSDNGWGIFLGMTSSPRTWGCFSRGGHRRYRSSVFPTHVGVFLLNNLLKYNPHRLPHARGGVSTLKKAITKAAVSSPRTWGCF